MCKLARQKLFKPCAVEGGDKTTFPTIPFFDYNILLNIKHSNIFASLPPSTLPSALTTTTTSKT
jgi:hypothetical protein